MNAPTPQEIRDRLGLLEGVLNETWDQLSADSTGVSIRDLTSVLESKTSVLHAAALTLLVEAQQQANQIAAAQVYASMGQASYGLARKIVEEARNG